MMIYMRKPTKNSLSSKDIRNIIFTHINHAVEDVKEGYSLEDMMRDYRINIYVKDISKQSWKGGRTQFMKIFKKECELLMKHKVIDFKELGFLTYLGVVFTEFEDNAIKNSDGTLANQKDIAWAFDMKKSTLNSFMRPLVEKNLIFEKDNPDSPKSKAYFLNPMVFFKGALIDRVQKEIMTEMEDSLLKQWKNHKAKSDNDISDEDVIIAAKELLELNSRLIAEKKISEADDNLESSLVQRYREVIGE